MAVRRMRVGSEAEGLRTQDLRVVLDLVAHVSDAPSLDEYAARGAQGLFDAVRCDIASYNEMDPVHGRALTVAVPAESLWDEAEEILARHVREHPIVVHYATTGDTTVRTLSDFVTRRRFHHTGLYDELYRPISGEYLAAMNLALPAPVVAGFGLFRSTRDFGARERRMLDVLGPHLARAYRQVVERVALGALEGALAEEGRAAIVLAGKNRPGYATPGVARTLDAWFGGGTDTLPAPLERWLRNGASEASPLVLERDGTRLETRLLELSGSRVLVLRERRAAPSGDVLAQLGLSPREAEVLALVADGRTNADIGRALVVSPRTVKKHLESVYEKLGVHSRAGAVGVALRAG